MARDVIFNPRRLRLLRQEVPLRENIAGLGIAVALVVLVVWVLGQRDAYNPETRDLPIELLSIERDKIELYNLPFKSWSDPNAPVSVAGQVFNFGLFPAHVADDSWQPAGRLREFGPDNLFEKINGEAPKFLSQGFRLLNYLVLRSPHDGAEIAMELFDQGDIGGSLGVFSAHVAAGREVLSRGDLAYFMTSAGFIGRIDRFFFRVAADREGETVAQKAEHLLTAFASLGTASADSEPESTPPAMALLAQTFSLNAANISYEAKNVFQFDFAEAFWFGTLDGDPPARVFLHMSDTPEAARALYAQLVEEQTYDYQVLTAEDAHTTLRHEFLKTIFVVGHADNALFGAQNVADETEAEAIVATWRRALQDAQASSRDPEAAQ